jgi:voltage-gated potassium channel Kch
MITAAAAIAALATGPALAQQSPSDTGTDANGPITILKNMVAEPAGLHVSIDGKEVDHLRTAAYDDITSVVHPGRNTMTVRWDGPVQTMNFKIAYAATRNNFKNVVVVLGDASRDAALRQAGTRTFAFTIPG